MQNTFDAEGAATKGRNDGVRVLPRASLQVRASLSISEKKVTRLLGKFRSDAVFHTKQELLKEVAPGEVFDPAVEDFLLDVADDFVDSVTMFACKLAVHRKSDTLEIKDFECHLKRSWDIVLPGFDNNEIQVRDL